MKALKREHFEITLSLVAAIASSVAAIGAFLTASYEMQHVNLERVPAIHLACRPEYRRAERAAHVVVPEDTLLLRRSGGQWLHVGGASAADESEASIVIPEPFARCAVKNYGRLPLLDMHIPLAVTFSGRSSTASAMASVVIDIPGLSADASYEFSLLNGSPDPLRLAFDRTVTLSRIDAPEPKAERLFADARVAELERTLIPAAFSPHKALDAMMMPRVAIQNFAYHPMELRISRSTRVAFLNSDAEPHTVSAMDHTYDSGPIDPHGQWVHMFNRAGRYVFRCAFHPYMRGVVVVR